MKVTFWGTRGSLATPGAETMRYGGNTSCVEVRGSRGSVLVLDAGTGIRRLGTSLPPEIRRVDVLLSHLHMDHIQGLGFFRPLFDPALEVHLWGPPSTTLDLYGRLSRYLSPPLFPVRLRDLPCHLKVHDVQPGSHFTIGEFEVEAGLVCHPGPTVGYRIEDSGRVLAYLPDHEPALGVQDLSADPDWVSGFSLARGADLLIHDAQYTSEQYQRFVGYGHSSFEQALEFASVARVKRLVAFHHDPEHSDEILDRIFLQLRRDTTLPFDLVAAMEGSHIDV